MLYTAMRAGYKAPIWCYPTGAGKSTVCSRFVKACVSNNKRVLFVVHKKELVQQFSDRLISQFGIPSGVIMAGVKPNYRYPVQVASLMSVIRRDSPDADVVIIDECHRANATSYKKILDQYPDAMLVGLTATPFRGDGKGLRGIFDTIVHPVTIKELIALGHLVGTTVYAPESAVDMAGAKMRAGDYATEDMYERYNDLSAYKSVVDNYEKFAKGKKAIVFNINIEHSQTQNNEFISRGIRSAHLDGNTGDKDRTRIVEAFSAGKIDILNNVGLFTEGFDVPDTECVILNRATKSFGLYVQMVGRGLRPADGKDTCIVLDHGNNTLTHGFVEDYDLFPFSLDGLPKKKKKDDDFPSATKQCDNCYAIIGSRYHKCPKCGYEFPRKEIELKCSGDEGEPLKFLDRDAILIERVLRIQYAQASKLPLHLLRIYELLNGYSYGWAIHKAIDNGAVDEAVTGPDGEKVKTPDIYKRAKFLIDIQEKKHETDRIIQILRKNLGDSRKVDIDASLIGSN